jgi:hypothetical protein
MEAGYVFTLNNFNLIIAIGEDYDLEDDPYLYLTRSDEVFWDILSWVYYNKPVLERLDVFISVGIGYRHQGLSVYVANRERLDFSYTPSTLSSIIQNNVRNTLNIPLPDVPANHNTKIPLYMISLSISSWAVLQDPYFRSQIFFGHLGNGMDNYKKYTHFILFWDMDSARQYVNDYKDNDYRIEQITVDENNVFDIFDTFESARIVEIDTNDDKYSSEYQEFISENEEALPIEQTEQREEGLKFASNNKKRFLFIVLGICFVIMPGVIFLIIFQKRKSQSR